MKPRQEQPGNGASGMNYVKDELATSESPVADDELRRQISEVARRLCNPLTSIKILIQATAEGERRYGLTPRDLDVLSQEIARLESLTERLHDISRPTPDEA